MELVDTHCHIHEAQSVQDAFSSDDAVRSKWLDAGKDSADAMLADARTQAVVEVICVGTDAADSAVAVGFVQSRSQVWASIGIHPHEAARYTDDAEALGAFSLLAKQPKVVAVGECGLDYFYNHSSKADQERILRFQIELALAHDLPMIFHVREAFDAFWPIFDSYQASQANQSDRSSEHCIRGVVHSFSSHQRDLDEVLARGLYIGLNGIMTFTKNSDQLAAAKAVPLDKLLLETDAPFLTPAPYRGKICEPKHVRVTAEFLAALREESALQLAATTTTNARRLFNLRG